MVPTARNGLCAASIAALDRLSEPLPNNQTNGSKPRTAEPLEANEAAPKPDVSSTTPWCHAFSHWEPRSASKTRRGISRRAVFSDLQRQRLEDRFQVQKYISKPDRKKLAEMLSLKDSQVKVWFQNRRMKWRNCQEREMLSARNRIRQGDLYDGNNNSTSRPEID